MTETEATWTARVKDWRASGMTAPAFCAGKGYSDSTLRYWASRLGKAKASAARAPEVRLARVVRAAAAPEAAET